MSLRKPFAAASAVFVAVPGLAVLLSGIGAPPGYRLVFGGVIEACGAFAILVLWINRERLGQRPVATITRWAVGFLGLFLVLLILYLGLYNWCVVEHSVRGTVYYPLWTSGRLADWIGQYGRLGVMNEYGIEDVRDEISNQPYAVRILTTIVLLCIYQGVFTALAIAFGWLGIVARQMMDPASVISTISVGLNLVDKFVDLVARLRGQEPRKHSVEASKEGDDLTIRVHGDEFERVRPTQLRLNEWDETRYQALYKRVKSNWNQFNGMFAETTGLSVDERVRVEQRMEEKRQELCRDFREMINIYEKTLGVSLEDHYTLYQTCGDLLE